MRSSIKHLEEIEKHKDERVRSSFQAKLQSYHVLKTTAPIAPEVQKCGAGDRSPNDRNDTIIVNELYANRVDLIISEDRGLHVKASALGIADRTFTIDSFLEKVTGRKS